MVVGKIISIFDISIEVILSDNTIKIGDILTLNNDDSYSFEVVAINNISATCISLGSTRGLKKGSEVVNLSGTSELADDDRPTTTAMTLFNRYVFSTKESQDTVYVFFAGGYNLDGYILLDSELNVRAVSTWNYH